MARREETYCLSRYSKEIHCCTVFAIGWRDGRRDDESLSENATYYTRELQRINVKKPSHVCRCSKAAIHSPSNQHLQLTNRYWNNL